MKQLSMFQISLGKKSRQMNWLLRMLWKTIWSNTRTMMTAGSRFHAFQEVEN